MPPDAPDVRLLPDYGAGTYRRRIRLESEPGRVTGELQDDFHHFAVDLRHAGGRVTDARGGGLRMPWATCGGAVPVLAEIHDAPVGARPRQTAALTDPRRHCTHLFDLACLAVAHAGRGPGAARCYDVSIPDRRGGATTASLSLDGSPFLVWELQGDRILGPEPFAGRAISSRDFGAFAAGLDAGMSEAASVLRRAVFISVGRRYDFERMRDAGEFASVVGGACHSFSPEQLPHARRNPGTRRDFGADPSAVFTEGFTPACRSFLEAAGA